MHNTPIYERVNKKNKKKVVKMWNEMRRRDVIM